MSFIIGRSKGGGDSDRLEKKLAVWKRNWQIGKESGILGKKVKAWERKWQNRTNMSRYGTSGEDYLKFGEIGLDWESVESVRRERIVKDTGRLGYIWRDTLIGGEGNLDGK